MYRGNMNNTWCNFVDTYQIIRLSWYSFGLSVMIRPHVIINLMIFNNYIHHLINK